MESIHGMLNAGTAQMADAVATTVASTAYAIVDAVPDKGCRLLAEGPLLYWFAEDVRLQDASMERAAARAQASKDKFGVAETELATADVSKFNCKKVVKRLLTRELNAYSGLDPAFVGEWKWGRWWICSPPRHTTLAHVRMSQRAPCGGLTCW